MSKNKLARHNQRVNVHQSAGKQVSAASVTHMASSFTGPVPPPELLFGYERALPGSADRILSMAESQAAHRHALEMCVATGGTRDSLLGIICGAVIAVGSIAAGTLCVLSGHDAAGATVATASLASIVGVFIYGTRARSKEREVKSKQLNLPLDEPGK
jgi:uncharacterized membrane protein